MSNLTEDLVLAFAAQQGWSERHTLLQVCRFIDWQPKDVQTHLLAALREDAAEENASEEIIILSPVVQITRVPGTEQIPAEGITLSDGGVIEWPDPANGEIRRRDVHGNCEDIRRPDDADYQEWAQLFHDTSHAADCPYRHKGECECHRRFIDG